MCECAAQCNLAVRGNGRVIPVDGQYIKLGGLLLLVCCWYCIPRTTTLYDGIYDYDELCQHQGGCKKVVHCVNMGYFLKLTLNFKFDGKGLFFKDCHLNF